MHFCLGGKLEFAHILRREEGRRGGGGAESASSRLIEPNLAQDIKSSPGGYLDLLFFSSNNVRSPFLNFLPHKVFPAFFAKERNTKNIRMNLHGERGNLSV